MFGIFEDITKAAINVVKTPVTVVADVVTMGGILTDQDKPYTVQNAEELVDNLSNATKPRK